MATRPKSPTTSSPTPVIRKVTFTGSTPVGKQLAALAGKHMKRVTMELGGHAPVIVAEDADVAGRQGGRRRQVPQRGQVCISPTRFLVHESIRAEFAAALAKYAQGLKVGDGLAEGTQMGPLANPRRLTAMADLLADAVQQGARCWPVAAHWVRRQLLAAHRAERRAPVGACSTKSPSAPWPPSAALNKLDEAIAEANRLPFGLAGLCLHQSLKNATCWPSAWKWACCGSTSPPCLRPSCRLAA
jgi:succinate-semialdehyde dehydrogenase/glutarate-semialdehyde dehydrogenase